MVKKLFKHEFDAYKRFLLPIYLILLAVSVFTRILYFFETDTTVFRIISVSSIIALTVTSVVCIVLTFVNIITRFYKNLFTNEGYLSFTLPVTTEQHIFVKLTVGVIAAITSLLSVIIGVCIATAGEMTVELFKVVGYFFKKVPPLFEGNFWFYFIEIVLLVLVALVMSILLFYSCIAIGQLSKKNRVLAAVGAYFGYYLIEQVLGTIFIIVFYALQNTDFYTVILRFMEKNPFEFIHIAFAIAFVIYALLALLFFFITNTIIKKKLNLE